MSNVSDKIQDVVTEIPVVGDFAKLGLSILKGLGISIKGKTPTKTWNDVEPVFRTYFDAVLKTYFDENYYYKFVDLERGTFDMSVAGAKGIWVVGMVLFTKDTNEDKGILTWGRYGTMENRIGNSGMGNPAGGIVNGQKITKDIGRSFCGVSEIESYINKRSWKIDNDVQKTTELEDIDDKLQAGVGKYAGYAIVVIIILALAYMFFTSGSK